MGKSLPRFLSALAISENLKSFLPRKGTLPHAGGVPMTSIVAGFGHFGSALYKFMPFIR